MKKVKTEKNNDSPRGVIPDTRKLSRNNLAWRIIIFIIALTAISVNIVAKNVFAEGATYTFTVDVPETPVLEITLLDQNNQVTSGGTINVTPSMAYAGFNEIGLNVKVGTSSTYGYTLAMQVANTNLLDSSTSATIPTLTADETGHPNGYTCSASTQEDCDFTVNTWGFRVASNTSEFPSGSNYLPVTSMKTLDIYTDGATNGNLTSVYFGSRVNAAKPAGSYSTTIDFVAVANVGERPYMQDMTDFTIAAQMNEIGSTAYLYDARDEKSYLVGKLADGKYWMLENLALDPATLSSGVTLSQDNTNMPVVDSAGFGTTFASMASTTTGFDSYTTPQINTGYKTTEEPLAMGQSGTGKIGTYHNYCAASAGTYCMDSSSGSGDAEYDICPAGWRLPTSGETGEYQNLRNQYASSGDFATALHTPLSGYFYSGSATYQGAYGYFWSSTYYDAPAMYDLSVGATDVNPQSSYRRSNGFSVRCVYDEDYIGVKTMQDLAALSPNAEAKMLSRMETGKAYSLKDTRDGKYYRVAKLADGRLWMLDNLALDPATLTTTLTTANTNMDPNTAFTLPSSISTGFSSYTTAQINTDSKDTDVALAMGQSGTGKVGVYYNYCAASAGTYCMDSSSGSGNAQYDICPAGWRLPTGGETGEYQNLRNQYSSDGDFANALHTPLSGYFDGGSALNQGAYGHFWSSTYYTAPSMHDLRVYATGVDLQSVNRRRFGFSVRCVAKSNPVALSVRTLQDLSGQNASVRAKMVEDMTTGQAYTLRDSRDNTYYRIAKLADGRIWMLDNLALDPTDPSVTLNESNTNATATQLAAYLDSDTGVKDVSSSLSSFTSAQINTDYIDTDVALALKQPGTGKIGVYYNYCAATAGTYCYYYNSNSDYEAHDGINAQYDICPKGWRLPTGGPVNTTTGTGEFQNLRDKYNDPNTGAVDFAAALHTPLSGYFFGGSAGNQGAYGFFWSSTYYSAPGMYALGVYATGVAPQYSSHRNGGFSVRCVLDNAPTMQEATSAKLSTLLPNVGDTTVLRDSRDNQRYTVGKLADDKYWMLDNLALGSSSATPLTPSDTNISSNWTLPASISTGFNSFTSAQINTDSKDVSVNLALEQSGTGKVGTYYNFCAATAGTYCMDSSSGSGNAQYDICPKGWRLPTSGSSGEFQALYTAYNNNNANFVNALHTPLAGHFTGNSPGFQDTAGTFWSSTYYTAQNMYRLFFYKEALVVKTQDDSGERNLGVSIRCVSSQ